MLFSPHHVVFPSPSMMTWALRPHGVRTRGKKLQETSENSNRNGRTIPTMPKHDPRPSRNRRSADLDLPAPVPLKHFVPSLSLHNAFCIAPATKSAHGGAQSAVPASKSAHGGSQSAAPTTTSAHGGSQSAAPATKSAHGGAQSSPSREERAPAVELTPRESIRPSQPSERRRSGGKGKRPESRDAERRFRRKRQGQEQGHFP